MPSWMLVTAITNIPLPTVKKVEFNAILDVGNCRYQHPFTNCEKSRIQSYLYII